MTIRTPCGGGIRGGQTHSQSPEGIFTHVSGIKVVMPSNPYDAKGLLITSIEDDDPVIFFEPKRLYNGPFDGDPGKPAVPWSAHPKGEVDEGYYKVPLGKADIVRAGADVTVITYGTMVFVAVAAAAAMNLDAEIIDLRSLVPLDVDTIIAAQCARQAAASLPTRPPASRDSAPKCGPWFKKNASGTWKRRYSESRAGTRPIRTHSNGNISPAKRGSRWRSRPSWRCHEPVIFKMPDLGEGTVDAEIVAWHTKPGDAVTEDQLIVEVMTDKAAVEVPAPVSGRVVSVTGAPGDKVAVGSPLIVFDVGEGAAANGGAGRPPEPAPRPRERHRPRRRQRPRKRHQPVQTTPATANSAAALAPQPPGRRPPPIPAAPPLPRTARQGRVMTSPANRRRAREAGIDLSTVVGPVPAGGSCGTTWRPPRSGLPRSM